MLSPDLSISRIEYFDCSPDKTNVAGFFKAVLKKSFRIFREIIYFEIVLNNKIKGITARSHW